MPVTTADKLLTMWDSGEVERVAKLLVRENSVKLVVDFCGKLNESYNTDVALSEFAALQKAITNTLKRKVD